MNDATSFKWLVPISEPPNTAIQSSFKRLGSLGSSYKNGVGWESTLRPTADVIL